MEEITGHKQCGNRVIIVSASFEDQLIYWSKSLDLELIGTKIEVKNGLITGKIEGKNCYGDEKVKRLRSYLDISNYKKVFVYGDSKGDLPMMELATSKFYRKF